MWRKFAIWINQLWIIGRQSKTAYLRFYPNPGFMMPWTKSRTLKWSKHYGLTIRSK